MPPLLPKVVVCNAGYDQNVPVWCTFTNAQIALVVFLRKHKMLTVGPEM